jgi:hypothetical protein
LAAHFGDVTEVVEESSMAIGGCLKNFIDAAAEDAMKCQNLDAFGGAAEELAVLDR